MSSSESSPESEESGGGPAGISISSSSSSSSSDFSTSVGVVRSVSAMGWVSEFDRERGETHPLPRAWGRTGVEMLPFPLA